MALSSPRTRLRLLGGAFILVGLLLMVRLYFVQVVHGKEYAQDALGQYVEENPETGDRGTIFFSPREGPPVAAALMQQGWRVAIVPKLVADTDKTYSALNAIIPVDGPRFAASAAKKDDPYEEVVFHINDDDAQKIRDLDLPGVLLVQDQWRFYPAGELAAQAIGFFGFRGDTKVGLYGLEKSWQDTLALQGDARQVNPFAEIFANLGAALSLDPSAHQGSIVTTIEPSVQRQLEDTLDEVMKTYTPKLAGGIVMDPHTGAIYAIGGRPAFDPNTYNLVTDPSVFSDQMVEGRYEMGSIMKPLTMAAGLDSGAITPQTTYNDTGCVMRSGKKVCNYDFKARGVVPMQEILNQSLNVGATFVADTMGHDVFANYVRALGMGQKTGIDLPNEVTGDIRSLSSGADVDYASASFGQGFAVSPIEMIRALSALANDGKLSTPHVVSAIRYESGITRSLSFADGPQVYKPATADTVSSMLVKVFDDALLKGVLKEPHYSIAAKTGTAQIGIPGGGGYYADRFLHSFFGYFPAHDPKFIVFLFAVEPHGAEFASATLAKPFDEIAKFLINYYNVPPDR